MEPVKKPFLTNRSYDALKWIAQVLLPATGALYFGLSQTAGLPNGEEVVGSITVIDTFLGALLGFSSAQYNNSDEKYDGAMVVEHGEDETRRMTLDFTQYGDPENFENKKEIVFKVVNTGPE